MNLKKRILSSLVLILSVGSLWAKPVYAAKNTYPKNQNPIIWQNKKVAFYVQPGKYHRELNRYVKKAVKQWNRYKVLRLSVTNNKKKAQVIVKNHAGHSGQWSYNARYTLLGQCRRMWVEYNDEQTKGKFITKAYIDINTLEHHRVHWSVQPTVTHEVGHALGISGHSSDPNSVMYACRTATHHNGRILKSDVEELKGIYLTKTNKANKTNKTNKNNKEQTHAVS